MLACIFFKFNYTDFSSAAEMVIQGRNRPNFLSNEEKAHYIEVSLIDNLLL